MALQNYLAEEIALDCADGILSRREAMHRLTLLGIGAAAATSLLAGCGSDNDEAGSTAATWGGAATSAASPASATPATNPATSSSAAPATSPSPPSSATAVAAEEIRFAGPNGELIGVYAPADASKGAVLVIHENRGLTPHIRSIPGRLAKDGYTALAIDLLSEEGGTASLPSEGDATAALGNAPLERKIADLRAGLDELRARGPNAKLAAMGFCFGGGMTWELLAAGEPRLSAAAPFYGPLPDGADFTGSPNAAVLAIYAGLDNRVNASRDAAEQALQAAGLVHEIRTFDGVDHAFFNDTGPRYNAEAATQAYQAVLDWFGTYLS
jgi:carboxymethylenebutenolidase